MVVINTPEGQSESKPAKETVNNEAIMVRDKDVFLPQIMDETCDESMDAGELLVSGHIQGRI